jgi:hypothetical protein
MNADLQRELRDLRLLQLQAYEDRLLATARYQAPRNLARFSHQVFSQHGEDGIIREIVQRIGATSRTFVEIGIGDGLENNTAALLAQGWSGCWVDGNERAIAAIRAKFTPLITEGRLGLARAIVTMDNIETIVAALRVPHEIDLLSIDIDRNTYWAWRALTSLRPRVVVTEYNAQFPPGIDWVVDYRADRAWNGTSHFGASLTALERLGGEKGYALVGCSLSGVNAFFVRQDLCGDLFETPFTAGHHFEPARYFLIRRVGFPRSLGDQP